MKTTKKKKTKIMQETTKTNEFKVTSTGIIDITAETIKTSAIMEDTEMNETTETTKTMENNMMVIATTPKASKKTLDPVAQKFLNECIQASEESKKILHESEVFSQNLQESNKEILHAVNWYKKFQFNEPAVYCNDTGKVKKINETYFARAYMSIYKVIYDPSRKSVFQYRPVIGCWEAISELTLEQNVRRMIEDVAKAENSNEIRIKNNHSVQAAIVRTIKSFCERSGLFSQEKRNLSFQCRNGVLNFDQARKTWSFTTFSAENYVLTSSNVIYNSSAKCDKFRATLLEHALNMEDIEMLQMYFGQCLLGRNLSQTALLMTGNAGCGKSVIVTVLEKLLGEDNIGQIRESSCSSRFETASYLNKHLLTAKDVPADFLSTGNASKIKALTGDDCMRAEMKYRNARINFRGQFNIIITSNGTPKIKLENDRDAWKRRLLWIRFNGTMPETKIIDLASKLIEKEGSGILNWAMEGAVKLAKAGFNFPRTEQQIQRVDDFLNDCDSLMVFSDAALVVDDESDSTISELEPSYQAFCDLQGLNPLPSREFRSKLSDMMERVFHKSMRHDIKRGDTQVRGFRGIKCTWCAQ